MSASGQAAGRTLVFGSLGPKDESVSFQVVFSQTATSGGAPAASTRRPAEPGFLTRLPATAAAP